MNRKLPKAVTTRFVRFIVRSSRISVVLAFSAERPRHLFLENGDNYMEYPMLEERDCVTSYRNSPIVSEGCQGNLTPGADTNVDSLSVGVDDDEDWDFNGAIGKESA